MNSEQANRRKLILIGVSFVGIVVLISVVMMVFQWYQHQKEIVSVSNYPASLPADARDNLERQLRNVLGIGVEIEEGSFISGAVREGTYTEMTDDGIHSANFLFDIDKYEQTFDVNVSWSEDKEIMNPVLISCPEKSLMKYPEAKCKAMYNDTQDLENIANNPIYNALPIVVDEFDFSSRMNTHYEIRGYFNEENDLVIVINDYSGGNYNNALNQVRKAGYKPEDYIIKYVDQGGSF